MGMNNEFSRRIVESVLGGLIRNGMARPHGQLFFGVRTSIRSYITMFVVILFVLSLSNLSECINLSRSSKSTPKSIRVAVTGATGLIGSRLTQSLRGRGVDVLTIGRGESSDLQWDPMTEEFASWESLEGIDAVVHLAGENVGSGDGPLAFLGRWSPSKKQAILESRVCGTRLIVDTISRLKKKPKLFVSVSGAGFYGYGSDDYQTVRDESSGVGDGFLAFVCQKWESEALKAERNAGMRVAIARMAVVLSANGGVVRKLLPLFFVGGGGVIGSGKQPFSWVSIDDAVRAIEFILEGRLAGPVNICSPEPATNEDFTYAMGAALRRPTVVPLPAGAARVLFGQMGEELLLGGQKVVPSKLSKAGFSFNDDDIFTAVARVLANKI